MNPHRILAILWAALVIVGGIGEQVATATPVTFHRAAAAAGETHSTLDESRTVNAQNITTAGMPENAVLALAADMSGNVYAGGDFRAAGAAAANRVAKWDGKSWSPLGSGIDDLTGIVYALALDGRGNLYAGGSFTSAGGVAARRIAKWDGNRWSALGEGISGIVYALAVDGSGNVYAGGSNNRVEKWDGAGWTTLGTAMDSWVTALVTDAAGNVYAGGCFTAIGEASAKHVARWNGASWSALGSGMEGTYSCVCALAIDSAGKLYAGGSFFAAGGVPAAGIAMWNGTGWACLGSGMSGGKYVSVQALAFDSSGNLYAGGTFTEAGGSTTGHIARWDGTRWSAAGAGIQSWVVALAFDIAGTAFAGVGS